MEKLKNFFMKKSKNKEQYVISRTVEDFGITEDKYMLIVGVVDNKETAEQALEVLANGEYDRLVANGDKPCKEVKSSNKIIITVGIIGGYNTIYEIHKTFKWD